PVGALIFVGMLTEKRWAMSDALANLLGVLIAVGGVWWMLVQIYAPTGSVIIPLPTGLVPHIGPIMIALLLVKLFRPRQANDFWVFQGMGLLQVALACALASEPRFGLYFCGYVFSGLTCLGLASVHNAGTTPKPELHVLHSPFLVRPFLWAMAVALLGGVGFLAAPRGAWQAWHPLQSFGLSSAPFRPTTGYTEEINLNTVGEIQLDDEVV